jgi:serine/threonine protein kinase
MKYKNSTPLIRIQRNILVNHHGVACLGDFGLSHMVCDETLWMTSASVAPGTVRWMAPELLTGTQPTVTLASDVWAFGMSALVIQTLFPAQVFNLTIEFSGDIN